MILKDLFFLFAAVLIILLALLWIKRYFFEEKNRQNKKKSGKVSNVKCPVCNSFLLENQNLISKVFGKIGKSDDQLCYVYGCPNCYPLKKDVVDRLCPVCHKKIEQDDYLFARMFNKTKSGKPHVIINGCKNCNRKS